MNNKILINLVIIVNDNCNLNCTDCQSFCAIENNNYNLSLNNLYTSIPLLKQFFHIQKIRIMGGETFLYQNLLKVCQYLRQEFEKIPIEILSNGLNFKTLSINYYKILKKLNITCSFSLYPIEEEILNFKKYENLNLDINFYNIRPVFSRATFNTKGISNSKKFFSCIFSKYPFNLQLYDNKLFKCCYAPNLFKINININNNDYLELNNSLNIEKIQKFLTNPLTICKHCGTEDDFLESEEIIFWNQDHKLKSDYYHSLLWFYLYDYNKYYNYCHNCEPVKKILNNSYYISKYNYNQDEYYHDVLKILQTRFFNGEKDVFIPFNKTMNEKTLLKLKNKIFNFKNFININFYFISIDKDIETKRKIYTTFPPYSKTKYGNFYFLEANNLSNAITIFKKNSFLSQKDYIFLINKIGE